MGKVMWAPGVLEQSPILIGTQLSTWRSGEEGTCDRMCGLEDCSAGGRHLLGAAVAMSRTLSAKARATKSIKRQHWGKKLNFAVWCLIIYHSRENNGTCRKPE